MEYRLVPYASGNRERRQPAPYVVNLIARTLPATDSGLKKIAGKDGTVFYYDKNQKAVSDARGNKIYIREDLEGVKEQNLVLYLKDLYESFYEIQERFEQDCQYDKKEDILWS